MKRNVLVMGVVLAVVALPAFGAIEYEFTQKTTTEDAATPSTDLTAKAVVDGLRTRVDFRAGTLYPPGTYAVSTDSRRIFFVDPANKSYTEVNLGGATTPLKSGKIVIENFKSNVERLTDRPTIAGIETDHYRITVNYDITVRMGNLPLKRHVNTVIDSWTTTRFGTLAPDFIAAGGTIHTGDPEIDKLFEAVKTPGFPMRQTMTVKTQHNLPANRKSTIEVPPVRTSVREMWVNSIRETRGEGISFTVPSAYARADIPDAPHAATKTLSFDPEGK
jgi:hypothetical protein